MRVLVATFMAACVVGGANAQAPVPNAPLSQFSGDYRIVRGPSGVVRIAPALGGTYAEWRVNFGSPAHELRLMVGVQKADGSYPVWRFEQEQEPAPAVGQEGIARFDADELVAEFPASGSNQDGRILFASVGS